MATIDIVALLEERDREEVKRLLVDEGIANDLGHAEYIIAISLGESKGDRIEVNEGPTTDKS